MVEHGGGVEKYLEDQDSHRRCSERYDYGELDNHREQDLDRVETQPRADIDVEIGMMHSVQAPKRWHGMKEHMLKVDREIQQDNRGHYGNPGRDWHYVEEAKSVRGSNEGQTRGCGWKEDA